jgi:hypothetical protein
MICRHCIAYNAMKAIMEDIGIPLQQSFSPCWHMLYLEAEFEEGHCVAEEREQERQGA